MTTALASSFPLRQSHSEALNLSQQTEQYLRKYASNRTSIPIPLVSHPDSTEIWITFEQLLLACLRTGDDKAAHLCLEKLVDRFGVTNERVMGLRGLYQEAVAEDHAALERILQEYEEVLAEDPVNTVSSPRAVGLKRSYSLATNAAGDETSHCASSEPPKDGGGYRSSRRATRGLSSRYRGMDGAL